MQSRIGFVASPCKGWKSTEKIFSSIQILDYHVDVPEFCNCFFEGVLFAIGRGARAVK